LVAFSDDHVAHPGFASEDLMAKPIVKWAGGKGQLLDVLLKYVPAKFGTYFEPFAGGAALFFKLQELGRLGGGAFLNDLCAPLIQEYECVRDDLEILIDALRDHRDHRIDDPKEDYYTTRARVNASGWCLGDLIYLNRTCYNGLFRLNKAGKFNVPMGRYANPKVLDEPGLEAASKAFQQAAAFTSLDFEVAVMPAAPGDFVYFDPPYLPVKADSFVDYGKDAFTLADHERLVSCAEQLVGRGVHVLMSNADVPWIRDRIALSSALQLEAVVADRQVNSRVQCRRKSAAEVVIWGRV
jgi:DNA adenine methylase